MEKYPFLVMTLKRKFFLQVLLKRTTVQCGEQWPQILSNINMNFTEPFHWIQLYTTEAKSSKAILEK